MVLLAYLVAAPSSAKATGVVVDLCSWSELIVLGTVVDRSSYFTSTQVPLASTILTDVTLTIDRTLFGDPVKTYVMTVEGGEVGDVGMRAMGLPPMTLGGQYVLFLRLNETPNNPQTLLWARVSTDKELPDQQSLRAAWAGLCAASPNGVPAGAPTWAEFVGAAETGAPFPFGPQPANESLNEQLAPVLPALNWGVEAVQLPPGPTREE